MKIILVLCLALLSSVCVPSDRSNNTDLTVISESEIKSYFQNEIDDAESTMSNFKVEIDFTLVDLNGDKLNDVIVILVHPYFCSGLSGSGCNMFVLINKSGKLTEVLTITSNYDIEVKNKIVNNYKVLMVNEQEYIFKNNEYLRNNKGNLE